MSRASCPRCLCQGGPLTHRQLIQCFQQVGINLHCCRLAKNLPLLQDAREMIALLRAEPAEVVTGCCVEKRAFAQGKWTTLARECWTTGALVEFMIDEDSVESYVEHMPFYRYACGGCIVEGFGQNFLKSVNGSYTAVLGLPLFELRQVLKKMAFRF